MRSVIRFGSGKDHYKDGDVEKTLCGLDLEGREFAAVASEDVSLDNICKRCYNRAVETLYGSSTVVLVSDEVIEPIDEFVEPVKGQKV